MTTLTTTQGPSFLFQPDPASFAVSKIAIHDASTTPVLIMTMDPTSSGTSIQHPLQGTLEYTQDPEALWQQRKRPASLNLASTLTSASTTADTPTPTSMTKELSSLLLKVHARESLRLSIELKGDLLDPVRPRPRRTRTEPRTRAGNPSATTASQTNPESGRRYQLGDIGRALTAAVPLTAEQTLGGKSSRSGSTVSGDYKMMSMGIFSESTITNSNDSACATTASEEDEAEDVEDGTATGVYAPRIYFAETSTEKAMHDLCSEAAFQQQLVENPESISIVKTIRSFEEELSAKTYTWDWNYHTEDRAGQQLQSHKAVFAFLTRNKLTGALEILSMFSLWIQHEPPPTISSAVRFTSSSPPYTTKKSMRHWRRSTTPEKGPNASRLSSFWNKSSPAYPSTHKSVPNFQDTSSGLGAGKSTPELSSSISQAFSLPLANDTEDGPLFRATVAECERHIRGMKAVSKRVLKAAHAVLDTQKAWVAAEEALIKELHGVKSAETLVGQYLRPFTENLIEHSEMLSRQMQEFLIEPFSRFYGIDIKAAELHRKTFEEESKDYYSYLSRYMSMKQDKTQRKQDADAKRDKKRRHFELKRLEYWNFLIEMRANGAKDDELSYYLTKYAEEHCQHVTDMGVIAKELQPDLSAIVTTTKQRRERNKEQQLINDAQATILGFSANYNKSVASSVLTQSMVTSNSSNFSLDSPRTPDFRQDSPKTPNFLRDSTDLQRDIESVASSAVYGNPRVKSGSSLSITGIRDLEHHDVDAGVAMGRRKEGFLFATSRPSSHSLVVLEKPSINWHKYWCVLSEGQLYEYSQWRKGVTQPHNDPINLRIATVRSCRDQDRRFCFEVITPKFRRVYQATSTEDMNSWINVISNAIHGLLNGTSSCRNLHHEFMNSGYRNSGQSDGKGLMAGLYGGMGRPSMEHVLNATALPTSLQDRVLPGQAVGRKRGGNTADGLSELGQIMTPMAAQMGSSDDIPNDLNQLGTKLLKAMRESHPDNTACVDCGAKNPEWCVINLGILVCIECSGIHRSLGTHISKVRSLTLDTTSYTKDLFDFIRSVGNNVANQIWEANLVQPKTQLQGPISDREISKIIFRKPTANDAREYKVSFIRKKYSDKAFIVRPPSFDSADARATATEALFRAVSANDIPAALVAFAAGANLNAVQKADDQSDSGPFFELQDQPFTLPLLPPRKSEDSFGFSDILNTRTFPIRDDNLLQPSFRGEKTISDTSSQFSTSTMGSNPVSATERKDDVTEIEQKLLASLEIRPRPGGGRPISSVMVLQTTPLLIALRHGVPFSLDSQYEVYPLAEFLMLNGAASNMSMEVKLLNGDILTAVTDTKQAGSKKVPRVRSEELTEGLIERDTILLPSSSIGSRLSAGTASSSLGAANSSRASLRSSSSNDAEIDKVANRRSVGQIVELRGEDGATAMEYLRSKSIARGEAMPTLSFMPSSMMSGLNNASMSRPQSWQDGARLRPSSAEDINLTSVPVSSVSSPLINKLTLSPRLQPSKSAMAIPTTVSFPPLSNTLDGAAGSTRPQHPPSSSTQDISSLFQKRRDSDSGVGTGLFATLRTSTPKDKERAAAKAQARRSGDFSMFRPGSTRSLSLLSDSSSLHADSPPPPLVPQPLSANGILSFPEGHRSITSGIGSGAVESRMSHPPSRTQKVKASLTKSIRLSATYLKNSIMKEDKEPVPTVLNSAEKSSGGAIRSNMRIDGTIPTARMSGYGHNDGGGGEHGSERQEGDDGEELTIAELLMRQDELEQKERERRLRRRSNKSSMGPGMGVSSRAAARSFFSSTAYSSTPELSQKPQQ